MLYLLDADVLLDANRDYYPVERVPPFWDWLLAKAGEGQVKVPREIFEEVVLPRPQRTDPLVKWMNDHESDMLLNESVIVELVRTVTEQGYASDLNDTEIQRIGRDPFLIAYALVNPSERVVVTTEHSKPSSLRANRHLPDVAKGLGVRCIDTFELTRVLDFKTN